MGLRKFKADKLRWGWIIFLISLYSPWVFSGGDGAHHGSIKDLIAPGVNFIILFGFLTMKLRGNFRTFFEHNAQMVQAISERAEAKSKEAKLKYDMFERKIKDCDQECENILKNVENEILVFAKNHRQEMQKKSEKLRSDAVQRLEKEKADYLQKLNRDFMDSIIQKASGQINGNKEIQDKITKKILKVINL